MKAETIIKRIKSKNACSIKTAESLTAALHDENLLPKAQIVRFRPLLGDFDILNADYFRTLKAKPELCEGPFDIDALYTRFFRKEVNA